MLTFISKKNSSNTIHNVPTSRCTYSKNNTKRTLREDCNINNSGIMFGTKIFWILNLAKFKFRMLEPINIWLIVLTDRRVHIVYIRISALGELFHKRSDKTIRPSEILTLVWTQAASDLAVWTRVNFILIYAKIEKCRLVNEFLNARIIAHHFRYVFCWFFRSAG